MAEKVRCALCEDVIPEEDFKHCYHHESGKMICVKDCILLEDIILENREAD